MAQAVRGSVHLTVNLILVDTLTDRVPSVLQDGRVITVLQVIPTLSIHKFTNIGYLFNVTRKIKDIFFYSEQKVKSNTYSVKFS